MSEKLTKIIIVGAGPVGLLAAVLISKLDIAVDIIDVATDIDPRPRGAGYGPSAVKVLRRAGVLDAIRERSLELYDFCWRKIGGDYIAGIQGAFDSSYADRYITMPVDEMTEIIYKELQKYPKARVFWEHNFTGFTESENQVTVSADHKGVAKSFTADFLIGCDGARSGVRRALFGRCFPGHTWDQQLVATNLQFPDGRMEKYGWGDISWVIDPDLWCVVAKIEVNPDVWRVSYGEPGHLDEKELRERMPEKLAKILPGNPSESDYVLGRFSPYKVQQRCAEKMRVGRVLLAGDAAHLCNPMGGLGLTGGMADVGSLMDCLQGIHQGLASLDILDKYDQIRRQKYYTVTDVVSSTNLKRLFLKPDEALVLDPGFRKIEEASRDPVTAKALFQAPDNLTADLTVFYDLALKN